MNKTMQSEKSVEEVFKIVQSGKLESKSYCELIRRYLSYSHGNVHCGVSLRIVRGVVSGRKRFELKHKACPLHLRQVDSTGASDTERSWWRHSISSARAAHIARRWLFDTGAQFL